MSKHTLFALCSYLQIYGKDNFRAYLKREGYSEAQISEIREAMKKPDYTKVFEAKT